MDSSMKLFKAKLDNVGYDDIQFFNMVDLQLKKAGFNIDINDILLNYVESGEVEREQIKARLEVIVEDAINGDFDSKISQDPDYYMKAGRKRADINRLLEDSKKAI